MIVKVKKKVNRVSKSCACCQLPALEYSDGKVITFNTHHGLKHINETDLDWILIQALKEGQKERILSIINKL